MKQGSVLMLTNMPHCKALFPSARAPFRYARGTCHRSSAASGHSRTPHWDRPALLQWNCTRRQGIGSDQRNSLVPRMIRPKSASSLVGVSHGDVPAAKLFPRVRAFLPCLVAILVGVSHGDVPAAQLLPLVGAFLPCLAAIGYSSKVLRRIGDCVFAVGLT